MGITQRIFAQNGNHIGQAGSEHRRHTGGRTLTGQERAEPDQQRRRQVCVGQHHIGQTDVAGIQDHELVGDGLPVRSDEQFRPIDRLVHRDGRRDQVNDRGIRVRHGAGAEVLRGGICRVCQVRTDHPLDLDGHRLANDECSDIGEVAELCIDQAGIRQRNAADIRHHNLIGDERSVGALHLFSSVHRLLHAQGRDLRIEEVMPGIGGQRDHHHRNPVVVRARGVARAGVAQRIGLHHHVVPGAQIQEFIAAVSQGGRHIHQRPVSGIPVAVRIRE